MRKYRLVPTRIDHMIPHVPTEEMVRWHNWHVYDGAGFIAYTAPRAECVAWIARIGGKPVEDK